MKVLNCHEEWFIKFEKLNYYKFVNYNLHGTLIMFEYRYAGHIIFCLFLFLVFIIVIELTHSKTMLENTVEIEP